MRYEQKLLLTDSLEYEKIILSKRKKKDYFRREMVEMMYLSKFIEALQETLEKHGDAPIIRRVYCGGGIYMDASPDWAFIEANEDEDEDCWDEDERDYNYYSFA